MKRENKKRAGADQVSELTTNRLSIYLRCLDHLAANGVRTVSSQSLAAQFHLNAAQIRKDLAWFGEFGVRGVGYSVDGLAAHLRQILGVGEPIHVAVIGAGNLGQALADYPGFPRHGFVPVALFDRASAKVGTTSRGGVPIFHVRRLAAVVRREAIRIAMIAVPAAAAQQVADLAVEAGIRAILNFAPGTVTVPGRRQGEERGPHDLARGAGVPPREHRSHGQTTLRPDAPGPSRTSTTRGRVRMVDVSAKAATAREAVARGHISIAPDALALDPRRAASRRAIRSRRRGWPASWRPSGRRS